MTTIDSLARRAAVAAIVGLSACGPLHRGGGSTAYIQFVNQSTDQADVYAVPIAGNQVRIGTVTAGQSSRLRVPPSAIGGDGTVSIVARIFASSRTPGTGRIPLSPGESVQVTLPPSENTLTVLPGP